MNENKYVLKDGKKLRLGYTTGSCAAAAVKAALTMLLSGRKVRQVNLTTPAGIRLTLEILNIHVEPGQVSCGVRKDSGDDPDVTDGMLICAKVSFGPAGIVIDGGEGIGRVTMPGLSCKVGEAAINLVPRQMIAAEIEACCHEYGCSKGIQAVIYAPEGRKRAEKTFNSRLGIKGGISILGSTGIVEPMSDEAVTETIYLELKQRYVLGAKHVVITPGNYGTDFVMQQLKLSAEPVKCSNFIGKTLEMAVETGFDSVLLIGHMGKLVKLAGGMMNTHSRYGDCRCEIMAAHAACCGAGPPVVQQIMDSMITEAAVAVMAENGLLDEVMKRITARVEASLDRKVNGAIRTGAIMFLPNRGIIGKTAGADRLLALNE